MELFRPVEVHATLHSVHTPPKAIVRDREVLDGRRGSRAQLHNERPARDHYADSHTRSYNVLSHERDRRIERREETSRDLFLTEKDYRAYGLQGDRSIASHQSHLNPIPDPYKRDYERDHLHRRDSIYRDNVSARAENSRADPPYLDDTKYLDYHQGTRHEYKDDPYHQVYHYGASSRDSYMTSRSRDEIPSSSYLAGRRTLIGAENLRRSEADRDRVYSVYAADALSDYNRSRHYKGAEPDAGSLPVSSRYSFAGPSYSSYR